jgi:hypothetical protein
MHRLRGNFSGWAGLLFVTFLSLAAVPAAEITITVGPSGDAQTVSEGLSKARSARKTNDSVRLLISGTQFLANSIYLGPNDSRLTIEGVGKGATISGGRALTGWKRGSGPIWELEDGQIKMGILFFRQLFVNGERRVRARTPNSGYFRTDGPALKGNPPTFKFRPGDLKKSWADDGDVEVVGYINWQDFHMPLRAIDASSRIATFAGDAARAGQEENARYFVENAADGLDQPGEWQLNRKTGILRYWPMPGEDMARAQVVVPVFQGLFFIAGDPTSQKAVESITFRNLTFSHTENPLGNGYFDVQGAYTIPGALHFTFARNCLLEDCVFARLGGYGVQFGSGVQSSKTRYCDFFDLGAGGVRIGDDAFHAAKFELSLSNQVTDCHIHKIGRVFAPAPGILMMHTANNLISHNHIHDTYNSGIALGWSWGYGPNPSRKNVVEYNHIHHIGQGVTSDMGGIYTLGVQPGSVIQNNLIHDVVCDRYGGFGICADEGSSEILFQNNIIYRCKSSSILQHFGRNNIFRNNIFAFAEEAQINYTREDEFHSLDFLNNIIYYDSGLLQGGNWYHDRYTFDRNVYFDARPKAVPNFQLVSLQDRRARGHDKNSIIADPLFVDAKHYDFRLRSNSPALKLGFKPIDISTVGPRPRGVAALPGR